MSFALFFLAEYCHIILMSAFGVILFLGGWLFPFEWNSFLSISPKDFSASWINPGWFGGKIAILIFLFIWIRASYPRIRYDQLMALLWKSYLPLSLAFVILVSGALIGINGLAPF
jgi:NADH:ubiquinone oxidoreductase subunit H